MRILCLLPDGFGGYGGIAQLNQDLLTAICAFPPVEEVVALPRHVPLPLGPLPAKLDYDVAATGGKLGYAARLAARLRRDRRFDLVLCSHLNLQPLAALACRLTGAPGVLLLHGIDAWTAPAGLLRRRAVRRADWFVAVSELTLSRFRRWAPASPERSAVLPCCVDTDRFSPGSPSAAILERYGLAGTCPVLSMARLVGSDRYKGFDEVLEVLAWLRERVPNLVYVIAGQGSDRARLEAKARALGVASCVRFTGYVPDEDKVDLLRAARAFVLAGRGEGFGIVLLEAMACGVPVVASTLDGSFEAVQGGRLGIAVDPSDRMALAEGILAALRRPAGVRPEGLDAFAFTAFQSRVHALLARVAASAGAG